ncbi:LysR family transcriptional regulator [Rhizobacter sp. Root404]|uniref:LysR family transcriptional regulator n=1 Tax=Rhizobacter sp. Root404 TaxID=1736528 RepID=UPI000B18DEE8
MDIRQLRYFKAIVECGSVSLAARRLFVAQPALSLHVRTLERELSCKLLERHRAGVNPTAAGLALYAEAAAIVERLEAIPVRLAAPRQELPQLLRIGFIPTALFSLLSDLVQCASALSPSLIVDAEEGSSAQLLLSLSQHELDAAFVRVAVVPRGVHILAEREDPYVVAIHSEHPLSRGQRPLELGRLRNQRLIFLGRDQCAICHDHAMAICFSAGLDPSEIRYVPNFASALQHVAAGLGVAIVPASSSLVAPTSVTLRSLAHSDVHSRLQFVRNASKPLPAETDLVAGVERQFSAINRKSVASRRSKNRL